MAYEDPNLTHVPARGVQIPHEWGRRVRDNQEAHQDRFAERDIGITTYELDRLRAVHQPPLTIPTSDGSGQAVHPDVRVLKEPWNGYRYWMAMTPYPFGDESVEMPEVIASNDGVNWEVPSGLINPIASVDAPGFLPDPCLIFVGDTLWCVYATRRAKSSTDGVNWSDEQLLTVTGGFSAGALSATVEEYAGTYYLWLVDTSPSPNTLNLYTGSDVLNYGPATICTLTGGPVGRDLWHIAVRRVVGGWLGLFAYSVLGGSSRAECHLAYSKDGLDWTVGVAPLLGIDKSDEFFNAAVYRGCLVPTDGRGGILGELWYSGHDQDERWQIALTPIRAYGAESLPELVRSDRPGHLEPQVLAGSSRNKAINATLLKPRPDLAIVPEGYGNNFVGGSGHEWVPSEEAFSLVTGSSGNMQQTRRDMTLVEGDWWTWSVEFRDAGEVGLGVDIRILWYDGADALISSHASGWWHSDDYRRLSVSAQVPAGAERVDFNVSNNGSKRIWLRRAQFEQSERPTPWTPESGVTIVMPEAGSTRNGGLEVLGPLTSAGAPRRAGITNEGAFVFAEYTTAARPDAATVGERATIYDSTLGIPIVSDGVDWRDYAGAVV